MSDIGEANRAPHCPANPAPVSRPLSLRHLTFTSMSRAQRTPGHRTARSSVSSITAFVTPQSSPRIPPTPGSARITSTGAANVSRLVLLHDDDSDDGPELSGLPLPEDEDESEDEQNAQSYTLSPSLVLLYLVSCSTRLGASMLSDLESHVSYKIVLPVLVVIALVTFATTQVWIRMARYVRKTSLADVVADGILGRDEHARRRKVIRSAVKLGGIATNVLLCSVYMRCTSASRFRNLDRPTECSPFPQLSSTR